MAITNNSIMVFKTHMDGMMRPNRFRVHGDIGDFGTVDEVLVKASSFPPSNLGIISLPFRGRVLKLPGDRKYPEWAISVYMVKKNTTGTAGGEGAQSGNGGIKEQFEKWNNAINRHEANQLANSYADYTDISIFKQWTVTLVDAQGADVRTAQLVNCWPVSVGALELSYDSGDQIMEFGVVMAYDYIRIDHLGGTV